VPHIQKVLRRMILSISDLRNEIALAIHSGQGELIRHYLNSRNVVVNIVYMIFLSSRVHPFMSLCVYSSVCTAAHSE
jgi:hypothetical protein